MNWSKSSNNRTTPSYLDYDAGPPLPPRNQLTNTRAIRLSDSADLLYEVPHEFSNSVSHTHNLGNTTQSSQTQYDHPVYATVQRKSYRYHQPSDLTRSDSHTSGWNTYSSGSYATMTWKRVPPPKPPRKSATPLSRSLSQTQYHSKSQHQLHIQSNRTLGYEFVPITNAVNDVVSSCVSSDNMKRSTSNDGDNLYAEVKHHAPNSTSSNSRFSTFLGSSPSSNSSNNAKNAQPTESVRHNFDQHSLMTDSAFSSLYDEIANGTSSNSSTLPHPSRSAGNPGRNCSTETNTASNAQSSNGVNCSSGKVSSLSRKDRAPSLHQRSKSEHHPLCPNFHPLLPPRPPLPPKPLTSTHSRPNSSSKRDNGVEPPLPVRNSVGKHQNGSNGDGIYDVVKPLASNQDDIYPERPPSPESAVDDIRSVIKPLSKVRLIANASRKVFNIHEAVSPIDSLFGHHDIYTIACCYIRYIHYRAAERVLRDRTLVLVEQQSFSTIYSMQMRY